ncbi:ribonuclease P protein component [Candidatus Woesebacteria bacterium RIFCSPHIGHO2_01_FULL_37_10]|uniref:Ribonuclease P protein component n=1 Tax=Candidatus Woesebacteria bacterium RIFCSPHIGHO2_01_FULL_37_10 TaxID=1802489 RepID=A0A1F7XW29_9BACT|nr:MAG: ribonuclease P protein component [Candidatus Woesebacteria bacterium RIFCSPHIGHO2_01_FULL_37_10]
MVLDRKDSAKPRFGFIVSTKVDKMSIHRNRVKRALSEGVRFSLGLVPPGLDMIFLAKKSIVNKTTEEIMKEVETFLRQIPEK